jgi:hypothetical protein
MTKYVEVAGAIEESHTFETYYSGIHLFGNEVVIPYFGLGLSEHPFVQNCQQMVYINHCYAVFYETALIDQNRRVIFNHPGIFSGQTFKYFVIGGGLLRFDEVERPRVDAEDVLHLFCQKGVLVFPDGYLARSQSYNLTDREELNSFLLFANPDTIVQAIPKLAGKQHRVVS